MAPSSTAMLPEAELPQVKCKGIHEPKGRVKKFRVEIRPSGSSKKIWVGTFDTRDKAKRAYDAAVYLTGKEPYYFAYPEGYFSSCPPTPSKEEVQAFAKNFGEKTDELEERVASHLRASSKARQAKNVGSERTCPNTTVVKKTAEKMTSSPLADDALKSLEELNQFLQGDQDLGVPTQPDWPSLVGLPVQSNDASEESKVDLEKSYRRGLTSNQDIWKSMCDGPLPPLNDFPAIDDESLYLFFDTQAKVPLKRKRGVSQEIDFVESLGFPEGISTDEDEWISNLLFGDPDFLSVL